VWALCAGNSHPLGEIADDGQPTALAADPTTGRVYVATADAIIALAGGTAPWQVALPPGQESVALALDAPAGRLYVASDSLVHGESTGGSLITLDARTGGIVTTVPAGTARTALAIDPHRHRVYLADAADGIVLALAGDHLAVVAATFVGGTPTHLAIDAKRGRVYSADFATGRLTVISEATDGVVASVPLGRGPGDIAADPASGHVFVAAGTTGTVTILDRSLVPLATLHAGAMPAALVADPNGGRINVIDFGNLGIWRIDDGRIGGPTASPVAIVKDIATGKQAPAQSEGD
jgi:DNA-binding beta-propeller fold protein YncE